MASDDQMWAPMVPHEPFVEIGGPGWRIADRSRPPRLHPDDVAEIVRQLRGPTADDAMASRLRSEFMAALGVPVRIDWIGMRERQREAWRAVARAAVAP